jgi:hypothetical protein
MAKKKQFVSLQAYFPLGINTEGTIEVKHVEILEWK